MNHTSLSRAAKLAAASVCLAATAFLGGCVESAKTIRDAQAQFSRAATVENRSLLGDTRAVQDSTEAATDYRMAATTMQKLIADKGGELKKDNLLCTAMIIEALSWWRLGNDDAAMKIANDSSACSDSSAPAGSQPARDMALFQALPGLIRIDQANQKLASSTPTQPVSFAEVMTLLSNANSILQTTRNQIGTGHPLQLYLIQSQLAIVRNWQAAIRVENFSGQRLLCETTQARQQCVKLVADLACATLAVGGKQDIEQLVVSWQFIAGCSSQASTDPVVLSRLPDSVTADNCSKLQLAGGFPDNCASGTQ